MERKRGFGSWLFFALGMLIGGILCLPALFLAFAGVLSGWFDVIIVNLFAFALVFPGMDLLLSKIPGGFGKIVRNRILRILVSIILMIFSTYLIAVHYEPEDDTIANTASSIESTSFATEISTPTPSAFITKTPNPTVTLTFKPTASPNPTATPTQKPTATPTATAAPTPSPTATPIVKPTATTKPTATPTATPTDTPKPTATTTQKPTATPKPTVTPTIKPTPTPAPLYYITGMDTYTITENIDKRFGIKHPKPTESLNGYIFTNSNSEFCYDIYTYDRLNDVYMAYFYVYDYTGSSKSLYDKAEKYLVFLASIPYDTYDPDTAQQWVRDNIKNVSQGNPVEIVIGDALFRLTGDPTMGMITLSISVYPFPY